MMALSVFVAVIFSIAGLYGAFSIFLKLFEHVTKVNEFIRRILCISSSIAVFLLFIFSVFNIFSPYVEKVIDNSYDEGYIDGTAFGKELAFEDNYDDGYLAGFNDGHAVAYDYINALDSLMNVTERTNEEDIEVNDDVGGELNGDQFIETEVKDESANTDQQTEDTSSPERQQEAAPDVESISGYVYYTENGEVYHKSKDCSYLKKAKNILSADISAVSGRRACSRCVK